jgi:hypothetical protein
VGKFLILTLLFATGVSYGADDKRPPVSVFSYDDTSCGTWFKSANVEWARAQYLSWFRGFVSGYNVGNPGNQVQLERMPNADTLYLFIDKYCRENPLDPFVSAAFILVEQLSDRPTKAK